ncbi:MAG: acetate kinase [Syntrophomonadaceae bacterium]|nr:acetate kinase [Syntrophomonadaceae bacterium]
MKVLVVNCSASGIKYELFDMEGEKTLARGHLERIGAAESLLRHEVTVAPGIDTHEQGMARILGALGAGPAGGTASLQDIRVVGHRVAHGGEEFTTATRIDEQVKQVIRRYSDFAPLHNPYQLAGIEACERLLPGAVQVAVFDTAFPLSMPPDKYMYALPYELYEKYRIRRYGFHGTSHSYVARRAAEMLGRPLEDLRLITLHLGSAGASMAAVAGGRVVDTSMGLTPLAGLAMGTRSGDIDPAIVFFIMEKLGLNVHEISDYLNRRSGILGLSGVSDDLNEVLLAAMAGNERALLAVEVYGHRVRKEIGRYIAEMNGCDALVFTSEMGENPLVRELVCQNLDYFGILLDQERNKMRAPLLEVSAPGSSVRILVIPTHEELAIAREALRAAG